MSRFHLDYLPWMFVTPEEVETDVEINNLQFAARALKLDTLFHQLEVARGDLTDDYCASQTGMME